MLHLLVTFMDIEATPWGILVSDQVNITICVVLNFFRIVSNHQNSLAMMVGTVVHEFVNSSLVPASIPVVGSSKIKISGSEANIRAITALCFCPPEREPMRLSRCSHIPTESD